MEHVLESFMNSMRHDGIFKILISACKQCSSLPPLFTLFVFDCLVMFNTYCVVLFALLGFVLCTPMLSVSQDCQLLIAPSVFSNVYIFHTIDLRFILVSFEKSRLVFCVCKKKLPQSPQSFKKY